MRASFITLKQHMFLPMGMCLGELHGMLAYLLGCQLPPFELSKVYCVMGMVLQVCVCWGRLQCIGAHVPLEFLWTYPHTKCCVPFRLPPVKVARSHKLCNPCGFGSIKKRTNLQCRL